MILAKLRGGLSNQLFQYAAARRLAIHHGTEVRIDASWYSNICGATPRDYELDNFAITGRLATRHELIGTNGVRNTRLRDMPLALWRKMRPLYRFQAERGLGFDPRILSLPDNVCLFGYWVSERYFSDVSATIRKEFQPRDPAEGQNLELLSEIRSGTSVSIHVRRGDYVQNPATNRIHGTCSLEYYQSALAYISSRVGRSRYFVFSDDLDWARNNLSVPGPVAFVAHNQGKKSYEDLRLMSACSHHIIANSGFSWWGAWLNERDDKIVCAPKRWFAEPTYETKDILPKDWVAL